MNVSDRIITGLAMPLSRTKTIVLALLAVLIGTTPLHAQRPGGITIERPGEREFVKDLAHLLSDQDVKKIQEIAGKLLTDKVTPIIVVTIPSMEQYGGAGMSIEKFAGALFDQWGIGYAKLGKQQEHEWNTGILLLVSKYDRKARIELGAGWKRDSYAVTKQIMDELIIPPFKRGDYAAGIIAGVEGLDKMARGLELPKAPKPPTPWWHYALIAVFVGVAIFTVVSLIRRGASGWAWLFWGLLFAGVGYLLYNMMSQHSRGSDGGGFGGGSFGGGFSGGGGATGSW